MGKMANVQIGILSIAIYAIILYNIYTGDRKLKHQEHFVNLILILMLISTLEALSWIANGQKFFMSYYFNLGVNSLYALFSLSACFKWYSYAGAILQITDNKYNKILGKLLNISLYLLLVIISINMFHPLLFEIDESMTYRRREYFSLIFILCNLFLIVPALLGALKIRKLKTSYQKRECKLIILFALLPLFASILQFMYYGYSIIWPTTSIAILTVFLNNKNKYSGIDELTELFNKDQFDLYVEEKVFSVSKDKHLAVILLNINEFKELNLIHGYIEGEKMLVRVARILKITTKQIEAFCARLNGDNFCVLLEISDPSDLMDLIDAIKLREKYYKSKHHCNYDFQLNIGYSYSEKNWPINIADLMTTANKEMYEDRYQKPHILVC